MQVLHYFTLNTGIETVCFITSLIWLINYKGQPIWRNVVFLLFITCSVEFMGIYVKRLYLHDRLHVHPNPWLYNILLLFQIVILSIMFNSLLTKYIKIKSAIFIIALLMVSLYVYEIWEHGVFNYNNLTYSVMSVIIVLCSLIYFYLLLKDDSYIQLSRSADFWWIAGLLFFYFGSTVVNLFYSKLSHIMITPKRSLSYFIFNILNVLLYSCWSYSFICRRWLTTTSQSLS